MDVRMRRFLGFKLVPVYHGETFLGNLKVVPVPNSKDSAFAFAFPNNEIRISHLSPPSERCPPLAVLQTISSYSLRCKLESSLPPEQQPNLTTLQVTCFHERKTAVVVLGNEEIHLVAMPSKEKNFPCFWCCSVPAGLYNSCLGMLNSRCLAIVFDLDETLVVANTMKTFEDRMEQLKGCITREFDPDRASGILTEMNRVAEDRELLKQYTEYDCVKVGGKLYKAQWEEVPVSLVENNEKVVRPIVRLPERNTVLTRIKPEIRDTSVLVRMRPAWEELRSYLTDKGRKRFEVFVCTMAERNYALEMWRLLDPEANLISLKELLGRVVCVNPSSKKSLLNVFHDGICHPRLAMVVDDRMDVWEDKDQPRVHVVPAYAPYHAPQAETANAVPVLCVVRNIACNIRGCFFQEFDENFHKRICNLSYEDEMSSLPPPLDVSNLLMLEDKKGSVDSASNSVANVADVRSEIVHPPPVSASNAAPPYSRTPIPILKPSLLGVLGKRDGFSSESDLEKRKRPFMMQNGVDLRTPISGDLPILTSPPVPSHSQGGGWLVKEDLTKGHLNSQASLAQESGRTSDVASSQIQTSSTNKEFQADLSKTNVLKSSLSISALQEIGRKCNSKVEFRSAVSTRHDLPFCIEVFFTGEKIGVGLGKARKDAQQQAAEIALRSLADKYVAYVGHTSETDERNFDMHSNKKDNGFIWDKLGNPSTDEIISTECTSEATEMEIKSSSSMVNQQVLDQYNRIFSWKVPEPYIPK